MRGEYDAEQLPLDRGLKRLEGFQVLLAFAADARQTADHVTQAVFVLALVPFAEIMRETLRPMLEGLAGQLLDQLLDPAEVERALVQALADIQGQQLDGIA